MDRNFKAPLSPNELASLRGLRGDSKRQISGSHLQVSIGFEEQGPGEKVEPR
jgi:hypothetical protein